MIEENDEDPNLKVRENNLDLDKYGIDSPKKKAARTQ